ncbi:MAG: glycosyltransferase family 4 protein [Gemmataceae bacterium]
MDELQENGWMKNSDHARTLLLLTYHFPPSAAVAVYRMLGLACHLPRFGWNVVVVAPPGMPGEPVDPALLERLPAETLVQRVPFRRGFLGKVARRIAGNLAWAPAALAACRDIIARRSPDAVLTSGPPHCVHLLGMRLRRRYGIPWAADLRDPWFTNKTPLPWNHPLERLMERRMVRQADAVIANTPLSVRSFVAAYPDYAEKFESIPNGFEPDWLPPAPPRPAKPDRLTLLHAGELYSGRDPRPLLDALAGLNPSAGALPWHVTFLGRSTEGIFDLRSEISRRHLDAQVMIEDQVPYAEATRRMMTSDALLLVHTPGIKIGVPAKLYEYLGTGRPVLALADPDGDIAWVLRQSGPGHHIVAPGDVAGIAQALARLRDDWTPETQAISPWASPFTREKMAQRIARRLDEIVTGATVEMSEGRIEETAKEPMTIR